MEQNNILQRLESRKYNRDHKPNDAVITFKINDCIIGTLQSIVCIQGIPKAGKSLVTTSAISSAFLHGDLYGMKIIRPLERNKIAFFDTESSDFDFYQIMERIKSQIYLNNIPQQLDAYLLREDHPKDIIAMIESYLQNNADCSILIIDGILDMIADYNNVEESFRLIQWFKRITKQYNVMAMVVLHEGKKDNNSIGHIGSFIDRKAQSVISVRKNADVKGIEITPKFLRMSKDFDPILLANYGYGWQIVTQDHETKEKYNQMQLHSLINGILLEPKTYKYMVDEITERTGKSISSAKRIIKELIEERKIVKINDLYHVK